MHAKEKEQTPSKTLKQPIGKPQKQLQKTLIIEKEIEEKNKVFTLISLPFIFVVMKKHGDFINVFSLFENFPQKIKNSYWSI